MMDRFDDEQNYQNINKILCFLLQMKGCIKVLKEQAPDSVEGLLNALRWASAPWGSQPFRSIANIDARGLEHQA